MTSVNARRPSFKLPQPRAGQFGFTLVELVLVIVIVGILGAIAAPRFFDRQTFDVAGFSQQTTALIRYAQKQAIAQNRNVFVRLDGASVALCYDAACNGRVVPAARTNSGSAATLARCANQTNWACEGVPNGVAIDVTPMFFFDPAGRPFFATDGVAALNSSFGAPMTVRVRAGTSIHQTIIEPETGFVR